MPRQITLPPPPRAGSLSRRRFLKWSGAAGAAALGGAYWSIGPTVRRARAAGPADTPLQHVVISMQENRSFDHYFGYAPWIGAWGPPAGYTQPDGAGRDGRAVPLREPRDARRRRTRGAPSTSSGTAARWTASTRMPASGRSATTPPPSCPFYYSLHENSTLAVNFFCSQLGPTWPNRFYHMAGTSGGITTNGLWGYGIFDYPMILDLLDAAGVTWKIYNLGWDSVPYGNTDNVAVFWKNYRPRQPDARQQGRATSTTCARAACRRCRSSIPSYARGWDEHPPADVSIGMGLQEELITALRDSPVWDIVRLHHHVRRARRVLRPRSPAPARRLRARRPDPDLDRLAVGEAGLPRPDALRDHVDPQVPRAAPRAADAGLGQPSLRRGDPDRRQLRGGRTGRRSAGTAARRSRRDRRPVQRLHVLSGTRPAPGIRTAGRPQRPAELGVHCRPGEPQCPADRNGQAATASPWPAPIMTVASTV